MWPILRKIAKGMLAAAAVGVVVVLLGIGGFRLLVTQLPSYQTQLQTWVSDSLGLKLDFERLDARWVLRGPELTFHEARVGAKDQTLPFLTARTASVGLNPFDLLATLVARRAPRIARLTFEGTELTLVQNEEGQLRLQGAPSQRASFALDVPPDVEIIVRDSRVVYLDQGRNRAWTFQDVTASMNRDSGTLLLEALARPPSDLGSRIELTAQGIIEGGSGRDARLSGEWRVFANIRDVDLAVVARVLPDEATVVPQAGNGDVSVWLDWEDSKLARGTAEVALNDVVLPRVLGTAESKFERIALTSEWEQRADGWRLVLNDIEIARAGRLWPTGTSIEITLARDAGGLAGFTLNSDFLRLEDLTPFFSPLPDSRLLQSWFALAPRGDLRAATLSLERSAAGWQYGAAAQFENVGVTALEQYPGVTALTGELRADSRSGRIDFRSRGIAVDWPSVFRNQLDVQELTGLVVWRQGQDAIRVVSDDLVLSTPDGGTRSNLELTLPLDDSSPHLDLTTQFTAFDATAVKRYMPVYKMPVSVVEWVDHALQAGRVTQAELTFVGPVRSFPFDAGEGRFHVAAQVEQGALAFVTDWPAAEELTGTIEFLNSGFTTAGSGRVLGNRTENLRAGIADMRNAVLELQAQTSGPLDQVFAFLSDAPLIARHLGPDFARLAAPVGTGEVTIDLSLPLHNREAYALNASLNIIDGEIAVAGFPPHATEIRGALTLRDGAVSSEDIEAIFLDAPVIARIVTPEMQGYRARLDVDGEMAIEAAARAFNLPFRDMVAGQTRWQGSLLIPLPNAGSAAPARISIGSNLSGVALRFPAPFTKAPAEPTNLQLDLMFASDGGLEAEGYLGGTRRFAAQFDAGSEPDQRWVFRRAAVRFGGALPEFRSDRGVTIDGNLPVLKVDDWLSMARAATGTGQAEWHSQFAGATLDIADFSVFGQQLGSSHIGARRRTDDWQIEVDSPPIAGTLLVPADLAGDPRIVAVMRRLYLNAGDGAAMGTLDPRELPGLQLHADEFAIGPRKLGRVDAEVLSDPLGLRLASFESVSPSFTAEGSGGWFTGADGDTTRFAVTLSSADLAATLEQLGFDPIIAGEHAEVTANVFWPGPPSGDWMQHVAGDLAFRAQTGSLTDVQPGAGRMVGLLSLSALPRRLALDFRDVFNKGFAFDEITADFVIIDGDAYTDNLKLTGPVAEIGIVGRTGLRDHDYRQQAIVTAEPGKMLPTVAGLLGGPGVAAALLIFTQIFKEPLKGIGRASYCVTGSWQEPMVERLTPEQLEQGELCAELPPGVIPAQPLAAR